MDTKNKFVSDFLFSTPTFLSGFGSAMNLAGNYYQFNTSENESEADNIAIGSDFKIVGQDIDSAINNSDKSPKLALYCK